MTRHFPGSHKILLKNYRCNRKAVEDLRKFPNIRSSTAFLLQKNLSTKVVIFSCAGKLELFRVVAWKIIVTEAWLNSLLVCRMPGGRMLWSKMEKMTAANRTFIAILYLNTGSQNRNGRTIEVPLYELWANTTLLIPSLFVLSKYSKARLFYISQ